MKAQRSCIICSRSHSKTVKRQNQSAGTLASRLYSQATVPPLAPSRAVPRQPWTPEAHSVGSTTPLGELHGGCLQTVFGPGGYVENNTCQGSSISVFPGLATSTTSTYPAGLTLSHSGVSTSKPRRDMLLLGRADKPRRKETAAQTLLPSTEVLQKVPNWLGVEGGAGT